MHLAQHRLPRKATHRPHRLPLSRAPLRERVIYYLLYVEPAPAHARRTATTAAVAAGGDAHPATAMAECAAAYELHHTLHGPWHSAGLTLVALATNLFIASDSRRPSHCALTD